MKQFLLTLGALFILNSSSGQVTPGLKTGINGANSTDFETGNNNQIRVGYQFGALLQWKISPKLVVQPELLYTVKGYRSPTTAFSGKAAVSLNYINFPLLVGYRPGRKFIILAGPELGFLTGAKSKFDGSRHDISKNFQNFDIGLDVGLAYGVTGNLGLELRYNYGIRGLTTIIYSDSNGNVTKAENAGANRVIQGGIYYLLFNQNKSYE